MVLSPHSLSSSGGPLLILPRCTEFSRRGCRGVSKTRHYTVGSITSLSTTRPRQNSIISTLLHNGPGPGMMVSRQLLSSSGGGRTRMRLEALRLLSSTPSSSPSTSPSPSNNGAAATEKDDSISMAYHTYGNRAEKCATTPLVIGHGLFGSMKNWRGIARNLADRLGNLTYVVDWRNHGESPHHPEHSYPAMARDLARFLREVVQPQTGFEKVNVLGHSMGGKAVACFAVNSANQSLLNKLIIEDIAPHRGGGKVDNYRYYVRVMKELDLTKRKPDIAKELRETVEDNLMRFYLLSNVRREQVDGVIAPGEDTRKLEWQLNLDALDKWMDHCIGYAIGESKTATPFNGPTLLLVGDDSNFTRPSDEAELRKSFFPKLKLSTIPYAGHWIHSDQGRLFIDAVVEFLNDAKKKD